MERFERFRLSVRTVPPGKGLSLCYFYSFNRNARFQFRFLKNSSDGSSSAFGPGEVSVPGKTVQTVRFPVPVQFLGHLGIPMRMDPL